MTQLYSTLAEIYHEMYQHVFDYDVEYQFYETILKNNNCHKILEIGCGSGMLARRFLENSYDYLGLDLYNEMLDIARREVKSDRFVQGDMRNLTLNTHFDAVLITGRSLAYVIENHEILNTLKGVYKSLIDNGLLVFGVFDAKQIFDNFGDFEQNIEHGNKKIRRISYLEKNLATGWTWDWKAKYIIEKEGKVSEYDDLTTLRAFTRDEIELFLKLTRFEIEEVTDEGKAFTIVARKKKINSHHL
jgi:SAM-dependent methyltransferase